MATGSRFYGSLSIKISAMQQSFHISLTADQLAIVYEAVKEYQANFEAALQGATVDDPQSIEDIAMSLTVAVECEEITETIINNVFKL